MTNLLPQIILEKRPYQNEAISIVSIFVKNILRGLIEEDKKVLLKNSIPLTMATGSGKTFTVGKALDNIFKLRNRYNSIKNNEEFQKLNIVVLTHRINLVNQFRDDLVYGRDEKAPILSEDILDGLHISTYHSKADESDKNLETEEFDLGKKEMKDNVIFSTYQTAINEDLVNKLDYIDIILIDESHNVKKDSEYFKIIQEFSKKTRKNGEEAIILPITATPNNHTREIFGEEKFDYGLEKYLNSEHSPNVEYNLVTNSNASSEVVKKLQKLIEEAKITKDFLEKKN
ncbi:MAG: DEAD/DEAH box helicase family protein [Candidatus Gracilibacteria bacterium]|nr:DEAD/DEAH box helicase family protein [Candidatus Gracilibacteria bacterium]